MATMAMLGSCCGCRAASPSANSFVDAQWHHQRTFAPGFPQEQFIRRKVPTFGISSTSAIAQCVVPVNRLTKIPSSFTEERRRNSGRFLVQALENDDGSGDTSELLSEGDQVLRSISTAAEVSILTLVATDVVHEAQRRHKTSPTASAALGRALMGTLLLGAMKGGHESVQITFQGQGPLGQMTTVATGTNLVKGFVANPLCQPPLTSRGKLDVGSAVGTGILTVVRNNLTANKPYSGTVPIHSGEVAEDIAHYLADSEQMNVALGLGVSFNRDTSVRFAGGYLVQVLPFCSDETLEMLEKNILTMPPLSDSMGMSALEISENILKNIGVGDLYSLPSPQFGPCTVEDLKPRMVRAVASLGPSDVKELLAEQGHVEVKCEFCAEVIRFQEADLQGIFLTPFQEYPDVIGLRFSSSCTPYLQHYFSLLQWLWSSETNGSGNGIDSKKTDWTLEKFLREGINAGAESRERLNKPLQRRQNPSLACCPG